MTREDIIRMARDCGINFHQAGWPELERFAALVAAAAIKDAPDYKMGYADGVVAEREACAKVCDEMESQYWRSTEDQNNFTPVDCADAIRARENT